MKELICKSCANKFTGNYCNECGEQVIRREDRKLKHFLGDVFNALTFVDNKLWRTLKLMLLSPGSLSKNFVEGKRKAYMKPIAIFFLGNLIYFLFPFVNTFTTNLKFQVNDQFFHSEIAAKWVENTLEDREITFEEYEQIYDTKTAELSKLLLILMVFLMAVFFRIIHIGGKRDLLADHLTVSLELMGFILFYSIQVMSLFMMVLVALSPVDLRFLFSNFYLTLIGILFLSYFFIRMERIYYEFKWWRSIINSILCVGALFVSLQLYRGLLFFITYWSI